MFENQESSAGLGSLQNISNAKLKSVNNTPKKSRSRPRSQTNKSVFQDFLSTPLINEDNANSELPLLGQAFKVTSKPTDHTSRRRPKLNRQDGRSNSAFEPAEDEGFSPQSAVTSLQPTTSRNSDEENVAGISNIHEMSERKIVSKKKTRKKEDVTVDESVDLPTEVIESTSLQDEAAECSDEHILGIVIHNADRLTSSKPFVLTHPLIKVHILDSSTGQYLQKSQRDRPVTSYYEGQNVDRIFPIMTQPCAIKPSTPSPIWNELLIFNENFSVFTRAEPASIVFFEIMDFLSPSSSVFHIKAEDKGWYPLAWAFLKPRGANGRLNVGHKVRLQLYRAPPPSVHFMSTKRKALHVFEWFKGTRSKHPGSLYVTFKPILPPTDIQPALRSMLPMQEESAVSGNGELPGNKPRISSSKSRLNVPINSPPKTSSSSLTPWSRLASQACRVPTQQLLNLSNSEKGNFRVRFSTDGCLLACAACSINGFHINLYEIASGLEKGQLRGHTGLIYDLDWSPNAQVLLSASADSTARVWQPATSLTTTCLLPHPSYVYAAKFHLKPESNLVVTGCYDCLLRIWLLPKPGASKSNLQLLQELDGHRAGINAFCWGKSNVLYSGDSFGCVKTWTQDNNNRDYNFVQDINERSIKGQVINSLTVIPGSKKLLVETRDGCVHSVHLEKHALTRIYGDKSSSTDSFFTRSSVSPCGNLLFTLRNSGMNNFKHMVVWNTLTGAQVHEYSDLPLRGANVSCVDYHPMDHLLAVSGYGKECPVILYGLNPRGPLKPLPAISSSTVESSGQDSSLTDLKPQEGEDSRLRLQRVLRKLDTVLTVAASSRD